jgi:hypothetical protein
VKKIKEQSGFGWDNTLKIATAPDRVCHGYGKTRGFEVTGFAGTGTVVDFGTPRYHGYSMGILQQGEHNFIVLKLVFSHCFSSCHTVMQPYMVMPVARHLYSHSHLTSKPKISCCSIY